MIITEIQNEFAELGIYDATAFMCLDSFIMVKTSYTVSPNDINKIEQQFNIELIRFHCDAVTCKLSLIFKSINN